MGAWPHEDHTHSDAAARQPVSSYWFAVATCNGRRVGGSTAEFADRHFHLRPYGLYSYWLRDGELVAAALPRDGCDYGSVGYGADMASAWSGNPTGPHDCRGDTALYWREDADVSSVSVATANRLGPHGAVSDFAQGARWFLNSTLANFGRRFHTATQRKMTPLSVNC